MRFFVSLNPVNMKILGIDPGSQRTGYAVIQIKGNAAEIVDFGVWDLTEKSKVKDFGLRLEALYENMEVLLQKVNPHLIGFEKAVTFKNIPSALKLSEARGIIRLAIYQNLADAEKRLIELSPTEIKKKSSGSGAASKDSIERVLSMRFPNLKELSQKGLLTHDAFDALAVAWTAWIVHKGNHGRKIGSTVCP